MDRELLARSLAAQNVPAKLVFAAKREEFEGALQQQTFDLILSDFTMPAYSGSEALAAAQRQQPGVPFIFVSGTIGEERAVEGMRSGATDYVLKDHIGRLGPVILRAVREADLRRAQKAAQAEQRRLAAAVEQAAEVIVITDLQGTILYVNPAFEQVTGYSRREALGQNPRLLKSGRHDARFYAQMWAVLTRGEVWRGRLVNKRKDGTLLEEDASITPVRDATGQIMQYVAVKRDLSHETLLEAQLRQAQKMEAIGQLAGGVAHDFNNLLAVIRGNAELLALDASLTRSAEADDSLNQIISSTERAANLTRQLLAFSRKQVMQTHPVALNEVVGNLAKMLKRIIGERIDLRTDLDASLPLVNADAGMVEQVLVNLVVNARDAMPRGGKLCVATADARLSAEEAAANPERRPGEFVRLSVEDTGSGIPPEHLPRLFEPFFTTKECGKGTGLGLATAYGIIKQHEGWIEVDSQPGRGSAFRVFLPAISQPAAAAPSPDAQPSVRGGTEGVLLVEDDFAVRMITRRVLESYGYRVWDAARAGEAREIWKTHRDGLALLLTDLVIPEETSGRELAEHLCAENPNLKVLYMSGYNPDATGGDTAFFRSVPGRFLRKPFSSRSLLEAVRRCLDEPAPTPPA